jgi:hypothetical protein
MIKTYHSISVRYGPHSKRVQWKRAYSTLEFTQLLADLFQVKQKILGLQDQDGKGFIKIQKEEKAFFERERVSFLIDYDDYFNEVAFAINIT